MVTIHLIRWQVSHKFIVYVVWVFLLSLSSFLITIWCGPNKLLNQSQSLWVSFAHACSHTNTVHFDKVKGKVAVSQELLQRKTKLICFPSVNNCFKSCCTDQIAILYQHSDHSAVSNNVCTQWSEFCGNLGLILISLETKHLLENVCQYMYPLGHCSVFICVYCALRLARPQE